MAADMSDHIHLSQKLSRHRHRYQKILSVKSRVEEELLRMLLADSDEDSSEASDEPRSALPRDSGGATSGSAPDMSPSAQRNRTRCRSETARESDFAQQRAPSHGNRLPRHDGLGIKTRQSSKFRWSSDPFTMGSAPRSVGSPGAPSALDASTVLRDSGVPSYMLTDSEMRWTRDTLEISWPGFAGVFGGKEGAEVQHCNKIEGYDNFLCLNQVKQPYAPAAPGEPGLLLLAPFAADGVDFEEILNTFVAPRLYSFKQSNKPLLQYHGTYIRVSLSRTLLTAEEWQALPGNCRKSWIKRLQTGASLEMRYLRARISLRNRLGRKPSRAEVEGSLKIGNSASVAYAELSAAFSSGKEWFAANVDTGHPLHRI
ncbi:hypothetical protein BC834DRAFT_36689 [Gloeopeniophorella convolvens]|nr:hypothetical protein BC834DRAFT_36689 [Gloeopeniophorella convolvens]